MIHSVKGCFSLCYPSISLSGSHFWLRLLLLFAVITICPQQHHSCLSLLNDPACLLNIVQALSARLTSQMMTRRLGSAVLLFQALLLLLVSLHLQFNLPPILWQQRASASHHLGATFSFSTLSLFLSFCQCCPTISGGSLTSHRLPLLLSFLSPSLLFHPSITPHTS